MDSAYKLDASKVYMYITKSFYVFEIVFSTNKTHTLIIYFGIHNKISKDNFETNESCINLNLYTTKTKLLWGLISFFIYHFELDCYLAKYGVNLILIPCTNPYTHGHVMYRRHGYKDLGLRCRVWVTEYFSFNFTNMWDSFICEMIHDFGV